MNDNVSLLDIANAAKDAPAAPPAPAQQAEIVPVQSAPLVGVTPAQPAPVTVQAPAQPAISINDLAGTAGTVAKAADPAMSVITDPNADINKQLEALSPQDRQAVLDKANGVNLLDPQIIQNYGSDVQRNSAQAAGQILEKVRSKDSGTAGELLQGMLVTIDKENLGEVSNIPLLGSLLNSANKLRRKYQKVEGQIDEIVDKLRVEQNRMVGDMSMFDVLYKENAETYRQLKFTVMAGKKALADFEATQLPQLEQQAAQSGDPMQAQILKDFKDKLNRFAKRLDDLDRVSVVALQTAPQIKLIQNADQTIIDKINTTITTTIPVWKSQMVIAVGLANQKKALELQQKADNVTNELLKRNAAALHQGAVEAEKMNQRGVVDIETLQEVNNQLISTLKETVQIQQKGRADRAAGEAKMRQIEMDLKNALIENATQLNR